MADSQHTQDIIPRHQWTYDGTRVLVLRCGAVGYHVSQARHRMSRVGYAVEPWTEVQDLTVPAQVWEQAGH